MNVQKRNGVSIYCLSSGATLPEWLGDQAKRNLSKRDESVRRRIELLQDFQMPASSSKLMQSSDGRYITVAGTYPPRIKCYDVHDLSLKFERYLNAECVDMLMLSEDYGKMALLLDDRTISVHAPYGAHEAIRIPSFGRALAYEPSTCELLIAAKGKQIFRLNLDEGRFNEPWQMDTTKFSSDVSGTSIAVSPLHRLATVGCDDGCVRFWDNRTPDKMTSPFLRLDVLSATSGYSYADPNESMYNSRSPREISSIAHDPSGLYMAFGTATGVIALYDVRSSRPLHIQAHKHGLPIHTVKFHAGSGMILSSDEKIIKVWRYKALSGNSKSPELDSFALDNDRDIGSVKVNIEASSKLSQFIVAGDESDPYGNKSGVIMCATDQPKMDSFYVPAVGIAPKWCSFLENITEELEERDLQRDGHMIDHATDKSTETVFENYKFVSRDELETLGVSNLIGTPLLRGYMHGFFIDFNLYNRVKAVANPFEYEEYKKKKLKERLEAKRTSRINPRTVEKKSIKATKTLVNPDLAERLESKAKDGKKSGQVASNLLTDNRFKTLFTNPDYEIYEDDENFKLRNPSGVATAKYKKNNLDSDSDDDDDENDEKKIILDNDNVSGELNNNKGYIESDNEQSSESDNDAFDDAEMLPQSAQNQQRRSQTQSSSLVARKKPRLLSDSGEYEISSQDSKLAVTLALGDVKGALKSKQRRTEMNIPLIERFAMKGNSDLHKVEVKQNSSGSKEARFIPRESRRKIPDDDASRMDEKGSRNRRSMKSLDLKFPSRRT